MIWMIPKSLMSAMDQDSELSMETGFAVKMLCLFGKGVPHPLVPRNCPPVRNLAYEIAINCHVLCEKSGTTAIGT